MRNYAEVLFLLILAFLATQSFAYGDTAVKRVIVVSDQITFGDIFAEQDIKPALAAMPFDSSPSYDSAKKYTHQQIAEKIRNHLGDEKHKLTIPSQLEVYRRGWLSSVVVEKEKLKARLMDLCFTDCQVEILDFNIPAKNTKNNSESHFEIQPLHILPRGSFNVEARVFPENKTIWITGKIRVLERVPVATRLIKSGEKIQESDLKYQLRELLGASDSPAKLERVIGKKLNKNVAVGQPIFTTNIEIERDLKFGDNVKATLKTGSFQITFDGEARDSGSIGDKVRVFNPITKKTLTGILKDKGQVEIQ